MPDQSAEACVSISPTPKKLSSFYIASQVTPEGFDEIQRLILAYMLNQHVALSGPPGVGKTKSVYEVARILRLPLYMKSCSSRTTESQIISYPVLTERNGTSVTAHVNGPLALAMINGGIFYGDEFNLLRSDVQKRMNSAFDERRAIDRNDGVQIKAKNGFWAVISYNPTDSMVTRDLEDSVADRFIHFHYDRWPSNFKAFVSSRIAQGKSPFREDNMNDFNLKLGWRGIASDLTFLEGKVESGTIVWCNFFTKQPWQGKPYYIYRCYKQVSNASQMMEGGIYSENTLAMMIAEFTDIVYNLSKTGQSPLLSQYGMQNVISPDDLEIFSIHETSTRIESAALAHHHELIQKGCKPQLAQSYAVRMVIDQICYGQFRNKMLSNMSVHQLVTNIAECLGLLGPRKRFNTTPPDDDRTSMSKKLSKKP